MCPNCPELREKRGEPGSPKISTNDALVRKWQKDKTDKDQNIFVVDKSGSDIVSKWLRSSLG